MPHRDADGGASATSALSILLGLKHADGSDLTPEHCAHWHQQILQENRERTAEQTALQREPLTAETSAALRDIEQEARIGHRTAAAWCALEGVYREAAQP